jgi:hypothetical protein
MRTSFARLASKTGLLLMLCALFTSPAIPTSEVAVTVYQHCGYEGYGVHLPPGNYSMEDLLARDVRNDDVSSIRVPGGYTVTIYEHDFQGRSRTLTRSDACLINSGFNDLISSLSVSQTQPDSGSITVAMPSNAREPLAGAYTILQVSTERYVDAYEAAQQGRRLVTRVREEDKSQDWVIRQVGPDLYTIKQQKTQLFVDAYEKKRFFAHRGISDYWVVTRKEEKNQSQQWIFTPVPASENTYTIQQQSTQRYLDAYSGAVDDSLVTRGPEGDQSQEWKLERVEGDIQCEDPQYDVDSAEFGEHTIKAITSRKSDNTTGETPLVEEFRVAEKVTEEYWFETTKGSYLKVGMSVRVPIPQLGGTKVGVSAETGIYQEKTSGEHEAREKSWENTFTVECPPFRHCVYTATVKEALISVPYDAVCTINSIN